MSWSVSHTDLLLCTEKLESLSLETGTLSARGAPGEGVLGRRPAGARGVWRGQPGPGGPRNPWMASDPRHPLTPHCLIYSSFYDANSMRPGYPVLTPFCSREPLKP